MVTLSYFTLLISTSSWIILRKEVQELRATMEGRDLRLEELQLMLDNRNEEVAAMEERVTHTREARGSLQLRHNETLNRLGTMQ
jgi:hypothetical protein